MSEEKENQVPNANNTEAIADALKEVVESQETVADFALEILKHLENAKTQLSIFNILKDKQWHCRVCASSQVSSGQYAGGGGIQGLQRGTRTRPGLVIVSENRECTSCKRHTRGDRWTGEVKSANAASGIPPALVSRILALYRQIDAIEQRKREKHELVIDHRFPMERWGDSEPPHDPNMSDEEIRKKFQLLKKDEGGNHNQLKSRACERCIKEKKRGTPLGVKFWYEGDENWPISQEKGKNAEQGCVGCGWYDFEKWRQALNQKLAGKEGETS